MPWFRVDDTLHSHPKTRRAGLPALGLWVISGSYSCQYITEGFVPDWFVSAQKSGHRMARILVGSGLWERAERDGESGYLFHDWGHFQMTKEDVLADREHNRDRQRRFREKKREARNAVTNGVTNGGSNGTPTLPVPVPKVLSSEVTSSAHVGNAQESPRIDNEPRSKTVSIGALKLSRAYTDIVKMSDPGKICMVITNALAANQTDEQIRSALVRLANDKRAVTIDTLRIEIENSGVQRMPNGMTKDANGIVRNSAGMAVAGPGWEAY